MRTRNSLMGALAAQRNAQSLPLPVAQQVAQPKPAMSQAEIDETLADWEEHLARKAAVAARLA